MNDNNGLCVKTEEISRLAMEEVHEVMIKEEAAAYPATNVHKTSKFHESSLHDIENQIIPCNWTKTGKIKPTIQTDLGISPSQNHSFSLMETLQSRYITKGGYFQHIFVFSEIQSVSSSICFGVLNIRNEDQLLSINDEDVTLMTHNEVTVLLNSQPININQNITMNYLRPSTENITENFFTLHQPLGSSVAAKLNHETSTPSRHWKAQRKVTLMKRGTNKFLQRLKNDHVGFEELISSKLGINVGGFHQCHFIEERELNSDNTGFIRWYLDEQRKQYLYVTKDGNITLQANTSTAFKIKSSSHGAFVILEEVDTSKLLSLHDITAQFIKFKSNPVDKDSIDHIPEKFRFDLDKIRC
ncbi:uncharacterized protein LOC127738523 [Mytilus californianus]|uniref:uncharacterized protein LOC127738523 n=1 Tax=Mytilus californianus TaxID=6549 RepID=UPI002246B6CC|nr:uncharacterized protein LOC127738523 [Mytilus californianus]